MTWRPQGFWPAPRVLKVPLASPEVGVRFPEFEPHQVELCTWGEGNPRDPLPKGEPGAYGLGMASPF